MKTHSSYPWLFGSHMLVPIAVVLAALSFTSVAFCGEIHDAARDGDFAKAKTLLKDNPDLVSSTDDYGETPLHRAASAGHKEIAELMLDNKALVDSKDNDGWTPLHHAAEMGFEDVAELLLARKANVNAEAKTGFTPLHLALVHGHDDIAELLREHGGQDPLAKLNPITLHIRSTETGTKFSVRVGGGSNISPPDTFGGGDGVPLISFGSGSSFMAGEVHVQGEKAKLIKIACDFENTSQQSASFKIGDVALFIGQDRLNDFLAVGYNSKLCAMSDEDRKTVKQIVVEVAPGETKTLTYVFPLMGDNIKQGRIVIGYSTPVSFQIFP